MFLGSSINDGTKDACVVSIGIVGAGVRVGIEIGAGIGGEICKGIRDGTGNGVIGRGAGTYIGAGEGTDTGAGIGAETGIDIGADGCVCKGIGADMGEKTGTGEIGEVSRIFFATSAMEGVEITGGVEFLEETGLTWVPTFVGMTLVEGARVVTSFFAGSGMEVTVGKGPSFTKVSEGKGGAEARMDLILSASISPFSLPTKAIVMSFMNVTGALPFTTVSAAEMISLHSEPTP